MKTAKKFNINNLELSDVLDNLGMIYIALLFVSGAIWAFIAINNFEVPTIFKLSLIYSILLIFGLLGISYDRRTQQLGLDSRTWDGDKIKSQLLISVIVFALWYLIFMHSGFAIATPQSVTAGALFSVSPALNFFLTSFLGPIAENVFFFGVLNLTMVFALRRLFAQESRIRSIIAGLVIMATTPLFSNVPNAIYVLVLAGLLTIFTGVFNIAFVRKHGPIIISALFVGGVIFPKFHSYAYQLNEQSFIAAQVFGIMVCIIASYIGILPVDILHIANNAAVAIGL